jgi:hypothetical protein
MNYPIPASHGAATGLGQSVDEATLVEALKVVILSARANGQTLADVTAEVLADDHLLDASQRRLLNEIVSKAWEQMPEERHELATVTSIATESRRATTLLAG